MLPLLNNHFATSLIFSDRKNPDLVQLLHNASVSSCILADKENKVSYDRLNHLWTAVHHRDLGVSSQDTLSKIGPLTFTTVFLFKMWAYLSTLAQGVASSSP